MSASFGGDRLLVISPEVLFPTNAGGRAAVLAQCLALRQAGFVVDLVAFHRHPVDHADAMRHAEIAEHVVFVRRRPLLASTLAAPFTPYQASSRRLSAATARRIEARLPRPRAIVAEQEWTVPAAVRLWRTAGLSVVLSSHNDEIAYYDEQHRAARGYRRLYLRLERMRLGRTLRRSIRDVAGVVTLSSLDERVYAGRPVQTIPHPLMTRTDARAAPASSASVLFVGALDMPHAVEGLLWFARDVWPHVRDRAPDAVFHVAGRRGSPQLRQQLATIPGVRFHGEVADLGPLYEQAEVFVNPVFLGSGVNIKLADPIGLGIPSVTTSIGARGYEGLGDALLVSDDSSGFAEHCVTLLTDRDRAAQISHALQASADGARLPAVAALWREAICSFDPNRPSTVA